MTEKIDGLVYDLKNFQVNVANPKPNSKTTRNQKKTDDVFENMFSKLADVITDISADLKEVKADTKEENIK